MRLWATLPLFAAVVFGGASAEDRVVERVIEREVIQDPAVGASLPQGKIYETKKSWEFDDDELEFKNANPNPDGKRYLIWKDYHWIVGESEITVLDPRPYGGSITASRNQVDHKGRKMKDEKIMDSLKDQAGDLRRSREPYYVRPPGPVIGIGFGFGHYYGPGYYHGHHHHYHHGSRGGRYRYR